jgi:hypothetical protein
MHSFWGSAVSHKDLYSSNLAFPTTSRNIIFRSCDKKKS